MLSTVNWINSVGGDWDTPSNWSTGTVPGAGDDVIIDTPRITVTHSIGASDSIHSLTSQATLSISDGSLSIASTSTVEALNLSGGTITGGGGVTVTSSLNWTDGPMSGAGTTTVAADAALSMTGYLNLDGRTLVNYGTATLSCNQFSLSDGATIDNQSGATMTVESAEQISGSETASETINNAGALIRSGAPGAAVVSSIAFNNSGSVEVQSGELDLAGNGDSTGSFEVAAGAILGFGSGGLGGTQILEPESQIAGAGMVSMKGGTETMRGVFSPGMLAIDFGTVDFDGPTPVAVSQVTLAGGTVGGSGGLVATDSLDWTSGTMSGTGTTTVAEGGMLNMSGTLSLAGRTLVNAGAATWSRTGQYDSFNMSNGATLNNQAGATFAITSNLPLNGSGAPLETVTNAGVLIRSGATGAAVFSGFAFNNSGSVQVQSGELDLDGNGDSAGSFAVVAGATLGFGNGGLGGTQTLESTSRVVGAGTVSFDGDTVSVMGSYDLGEHGMTDLASGTANFTSPVASLGKSLVMDGCIAVFSSGAANTVPELDFAGGTLTDSGDFSVTNTLNWTGGTMGGTGTTTVAAGATFNLSGILYLDRRTLVNTGSATWSGDGQYDELGVIDGATIDNLAGATFRITNDRVLSNFSPANGEVLFNNSGTLVKTGDSGETDFEGVELDNTGTLRLDSGTLDLQGDLVVDGEGVLTGQPGTSLVLVDNSNLEGPTRNAEYYGPEPTIQFSNETEGTAPVELLEAMSQDVGNTSAGFFQNFAYSTLEIGIAPNNASVQLVDAAHNTSGTAPEAVYVNTLIVAAGSILDLNGLHLYARTAQIAGTILNGAVSIVPPGGAIALNQSAPGDLAASGQVDAWSVFGRAGESVAVTLHTGNGGIPAPSTPFLQWGQVTLLDANGDVLATASNSESGSDAVLAPLTLPADGSYQIRVQAPPGRAGSMGNYVLATYGSPVHDSALTLNEQFNSQLDTPVSLDRWTFAAAANQQVQFHVMAVSSPDIQFDLSGPSGFVGFTGLATDSASVTLPTAGSYTLTARVVGGQPGAYAFEMQTSSIDITLGTTSEEPLAGSGQTQLFRVQIATASPLLIDLHDEESGDHNEVYVKLGATPTRADYDYRFSTPASANQVVTVPQAAAGTWYILVYNPLVPQAGNYSLTATASSILVTGSSPPQLSTTHDDVLTLSGAGFDTTTTVALSAGDGTVLPAAAVTVTSPTEMTATFPAGSIPPGVYAVRATRSGGASAQVAGALTIVPDGHGMLTTNLVVPNRLLEHGLPEEIEIEYSNTGNDAMPAPLLLLTATQNGNEGALLTLDPTLVQSGTWNAAAPDGYSNSVQLLASGATAGLLQPGESEQVPVYWAGWLQSEWSLTQPINFHLSAVTTDDTRPVDWWSVEDSLRPPTIATTAWNALYPNLTAQLGSTWASTWPEWTLTPRTSPAWVRMSPT